MVTKCNQPILTITGSDGTGESGVQADIKTMTALGGRAVSAITSITIQNTLGIQQIFDLPAQVVGAQIEAIVNDVEPQVVKIGMIRNVAVLGAIADVLGKYHPQYMVYDPVVSSSRGDTLMDEDVIAQVKNRLLPLCSVVVVKKQDAAAITHREICNADDAHLAIEQLKAYGCEEVLLLDDEKSLLHGQNNSLASAIAVFLCQGCTKEEAIDKARTFVGQQVMRADNLAGRSSELYNDFLDKVARHYHTNSDVHFFANCLNVSARYLAQVTKRISGQTPKQIIDEYLSEEIGRQLKTTDKTVQEIAYTLGFSSQAHLSKFFKKMKGRSPSEWRRSEKSGIKDKRQTK